MGKQNERAAIQKQKNVLNNKFRKQGISKKLNKNVGINLKTSKNIVKGVGKLPLVS